MASRKSSVISVLITGDNRGLSQSLDDSSNRLSNFGKAAGVALLAAGAAFGVFAKGALDAAIETEAAQARLATILRTTGLATEDQIKALNAQAQALEKVGVASGSNITVLQAQLSTFDLTADAIQSLTPAIVDYVVAEKGAAATAGDFQSAANGLAQALQGNFGALSRVGFVLDETTKEMIANGTEAERVAALVDVLGSTYEGFNEKARETAAGGLQALKNQFGAIQEAVGVALLPILRRFIDWFSENEGRITAFAERVIGGLTTAIGFVGDKFEEWRPKVREVVDFVGRKAAEFKTFFDERIKEPLDEARTAIGTFVDRVREKLSEFSAAVPGAVKAFTDFISEVRALADNPREMGEKVGQALSDALLVAIEGLVELSSELSQAIRNLLAKVDWFGLGRSSLSNLVVFGLGFAAAFMSFEWLDPLFRAVIDNFGFLLLAAFGIAIAPAKVIGQLGKLLARIPLAGRLLAWIVTAINRMGAGMRDRVALAFQSFAQAFRNSLSTLGPGIISRFGTFLRNIPAAVTSTFDDVAIRVGLGFSKFGTSVGTAIVNLVTKFRELLAFLMRPFIAFGRTLADDLFLIGRNVIDALIRGLQSMGSRLFDAVRSIGTSVWNTLSRLWKISSPSKVFMGIGEDAMEGLALGLSGSERMLRELTGDIGTGMLPSISVAPGGGVGGGNVINITVTSADPQAVVEAIRRYTRANGPLGQVVKV
jgi:hypothetical protein